MRDEKWVKGSPPLFSWLETGERGRESGVIGGESGSSNLNWCQVSGFWWFMSLIKFINNTFLLKNKHDFSTLPFFIVRKQAWALFKHIFAVFKHFWALFKQSWCLFKQSWCLLKHSWRHLKHGWHLLKHSWRLLKHSWALFNHFLSYYLKLLLFFSSCPSLKLLLSSLLLLTTQTLAVSLNKEGEGFEKTDYRVRKVVLPLTRNELKLKIDNYIGEKIW